MIKGKVVCQFPVSVSGANGIAVAKSNGHFTVQNDGSDLPEIGDPSALYVMAFDADGNFYKVALGLFAVVEGE